MQTNEKENKKDTFEALSRQLQKAELKIKYKILF